MGEPADVLIDGTPGVTGGYVTADLYEVAACWHFQYVAYNERGLGCEVWSTCTEGSESGYCSRAEAEAAARARYVETFDRIFGHDPLETGEKRITL